MKLPKTRTPKSLNKFRGVTPSNELTEFFKNAAYDIEQLYTIINENNERLKDVESVAGVENRFLFDRVNQLEALLELKNIELMSGDEKYFKIDARNILSDPLNPIDISNEFNQVIPSKCNYISKLYLKDDILGKNVIPPSLKLEINQTISPANNLAVTTENNPIFCIDGSMNTCWQRRIEVPRQYNVDYVEIEIIVPIVNEIITNRRINTISISPHPVRGMDIINIEALYEDTWLQVPGFQEHSQYNNQLGYINEASPVRLYFNDTVPTSFKFTIRQSTYIEEGNSNVFYLGAYSIDIGYTRCLTDISGFIAEIELLSNNNLIKKIEETLDNKTLVGDIINYELYYINELQELILLTDSFDVDIVVPSNKVVIIGKIISSDSDVIPALNSIKVEYDILT
jgi:hypothetical protein